MNSESVLTLSSIVVRGSEQLSGNVDGEAVLLHVEAGRYFNLNALGTHIWEQIALPIRVSELIAQLQVRYAVDQPTCAAEVLAFLQRLQGARLLSVVLQ
jgi:hypothetical protein